MAPTGAAGLICLAWEEAGVRRSDSQRVRAIPQPEKGMMLTMVETCAVVNLYCHDTPATVPEHHNDRQSGHIPRVTRTGPPRTRVVTGSDQPAGNSGPRSARLGYPP
jgi:hypothetical protein